MNVIINVISRMLSTYLWPGPSETAW